MNQKEVSMMYFANRRIRRGLVLGCLLLSFAAGQPALARDPEIMSNLGAITISCSIYPGQAAVAGVATGNTITLPGPCCLYNIWRTHPMC